MKLHQSGHYPDSVWPVCRGLCANAVCFDFRQAAVKHWMHAWHGALTVAPLLDTARISVELLVDRAARGTGTYSQSSLAGLTQAAI